MTTAFPTASDLIANLEDLAGRLDRAHALTRDGSVVDLTGLSDQVGRICADVEDMAAAGDKPPALADALEAVLNRMDRLGALMQAERANLAGSVDGLRHHKRAVTAYGQAPPSTPGKSPRR